MPRSGTALTQERRNSPTDRLAVNRLAVSKALREARAHATQALPAQTARRIAPEALIPLEFRGLPVHAPVHAKSVTLRSAQTAGPSFIEQPAMQLKYTSLTVRRQSLPFAGGCSVVNQVRSGAVAAANVDQVRCWEQASGLVLPGADAAGGRLIGDEPVPERAQHLPRDAAVAVTTQRSGPSLVTSARPLRRPLSGVADGQLTSDVREHLAVHGRVWAVVAAVVVRS